ncbi:Spo0E family sporulation regulatory protein-aspartic acid phosphatase [Clostridium sp.]
MTIEAAKEKLDLYVALYGTQDERTLKVSQETDKFVNEEMRKMMEVNKK